MSLIRVSGSSRRPTRASSSVARIRASAQSITPRLGGSLPRKMFSVIESSGISASSWWMITMPACSLARMSGKLDFALVDDVARVRAVRVDPAEHLHQRGLAGAVLAADGVDLTGPHPQVDVGQGLDAGELLGDGAHLQDDRGGRVSCVHLPVCLRRVTTVSSPRGVGGVVVRVAALSPGRCAGRWRAHVALIPACWKTKAVAPRASARSPREDMVSGVFRRRRGPRGGSAPAGSGPAAGRRGRPAGHRPR